MQFITENKIIILLTVVLALIASFFIDTKLVIILLSLPIFLFTLAFPEFWLALSLVIGSIKEALHFNIHFDLTILSLLLLITSFFHRYLFIEKKIFSNRLDKTTLTFLGLVSTFFLVVTFAFFLSPVPIAAFNLYLRIAGIVIPSMIIGYFVLYKKGKDKYNVDIFLCTLFLISTVMSTAIILSSTRMGIASTYGSAGLMSGTAIIILFYYSLKCKTSFIVQFLVFVGVLTNFIALILSAARMPVIALVLTFLFVMFFIFKHEKKYFINLLLILALLFGGLFLKYSDVFYVLFERMSVIHKVYRVDNPGNRGFLWTKAVQAISEKPLIGHGLAGYKFYLDKRDASPYFRNERRFPHNVFLEFWCEFGIVGLILFMVLFFVPSTYLTLSLLKSSPMQDKHYYTKLFLLALLLYKFLNTLFSDNITDNKILYVFIAILWKIMSVQKGGSHHLIYVND